jgi:hypothetical protein
MIGTNTVLQKQKIFLSLKRALQKFLVRQTAGFRRGAA